MRQCSALPQVRDTAECDNCCHNYLHSCQKMTAAFLFPMAKHWEGMLWETAAFRDYLSRNTMSQHAVRLEASDLSCQPKGFYLALIEGIVLRPISVGNLNNSF